ncbi:AAA family ATPase, putative [Plasmodium gaboni]|uniref:AAA family ATPase, putative n=1 Tax=Plasmodium gaboni TaxID=647221 RepID=A0ABY1UU95_9APIC|nr:AAA family ATPase, putative [Plasmodium gaboni]
MNINFYIYDDEADDEIICSNFNVYCSDEFLKIQNIEKNSNAIIYHEIKNEEEKEDVSNIRNINMNKNNEEKTEKVKEPNNIQNFFVLCCFKNYNELNIKKKLENNGLYINKYIVRCLNIDIKEKEEKYKSCKDQNNNVKKICTLKVNIIKPQLFIPIKEIKLYVEQVFNQSYEYLKSYQYENIDILQSYWNNIKSKNLEKYINLSLLNTCLFVNNFFKISILGVQSYITVKHIILTNNNKKKTKKKNERKAEKGSPQDNQEKNNNKNNENNNKNNENKNKNNENNNKNNENKNHFCDNNIVVPFIDHNSKIVIVTNDDIRNNVDDKYFINEYEGEKNNNINFNPMKNLNLKKMMINKKEKKGLNKLGGYNKIKEDIYYYILIPLIYKHIYNQYHIDIHKGILLHGPPGCGKTFIALSIKEELLLLKKKFYMITQDKIKQTEINNNTKKYLHNDDNIHNYYNNDDDDYSFNCENIINIPEIEILKSTDLIDDNNTGYKINELFLRCHKRYQEEKKCSIIFIDEIEILCKTREENNNMNLYTSVLLNNMDGIKKHTHTILIGSTNYINKIDLALRRSGRFDKEIEVNLPNLKDRISIFKKKLNLIKNNINKKKIHKLADLCQSFTCSDINSLINISMFLNIKENKIISLDIFNRSHIKTLHHTTNIKKNQAGVCLQDSIERKVCVNEMEDDISENKYINIKNNNNINHLYDNSSSNIQNSICNDKTLIDYNKNNLYPLKYKHILKALKYIKPSGMKELYIDIPRTKFKDIGGYKFVKRCINECLIYPKKYKNIYDKYNIDSPKGILLYGPPGCSKTLFAKAIASEIHMNFISVKGPEIFSKYVGESEKSIRNIFKKARENHPCVIFFDEIDSIAVNRNNNQNFVSNRVLCQLLNEIDGITNRLNVIILAATNRPDLIDPALMRPGRFDRIIYVPLPNYSSRFSILKKNLKFFKINNLIQYDKKKDIINHHNNKDIKRESIIDHIQHIEDTNNSNDQTINNNITQSSYDHIQNYTFNKNNNKIKTNNNSTLYKHTHTPFINLCHLLAKKTKKYSGAEIVNICREASICALRQTLKATKNKNKQSIKTQNNISHNENKYTFHKEHLIGLSKKHFIQVLKKMKPQTSQSLINFYKNYKEQNKV